MVLVFDMRIFKGLFFIQSRFVLSLFFQQTTVWSSVGRPVPCALPVVSAPVGAQSACGAVTWGSAWTLMLMWHPSPTASAWSGTPWTVAHVRLALIQWIHACQPVSCFHFVNWRSARHVFMDKAVFSTDLKSIQINNLTLLSRVHFEIFPLHDKRTCFYSSGELLWLQDLWLLFGPAWLRVVHWSQQYRTGPVYRGLLPRSDPNTVPRSVIFRPLPHSCPSANDECELVPTRGQLQLVLHPVPR